MQALEFEDKHVHQVYEEIAHHFSHTRYKPWPVVEKFLLEQPCGSIGTDVGCGNGKYLGINPNVHLVGSDRSFNLIKICQEKGFDGLVCDGLDLPFKSDFFAGLFCICSCEKHYSFRETIYLIMQDFAISIAVIHHFSKPERRIAAIQEIQRVIKPGAKFLIFVWAHEQTGKRAYQEQDVFVPWTLSKSLMKEPPKTQNSSNSSPKENINPDHGPTFQRYYHMFQKGELEELILQAGADIELSGYDRDNWYCIGRKRDFATTMNIFRFVADLMHLASIFILLLKIQATRSAAGISFKTQALYAAVFCTRYLDLFTHFVSFYNTLMKLFFIGSAFYILYLMKLRFKATWDPNLDTFRVEFLVVGAALLALIFHTRFTFMEILWTFSIYLEALAILPQLFQMTRTGEAETITTHYLFALGAYRGLYLLNWLYRYFTEPHFHDWVSVLAGLVQTGLYIDFFYVYFTRVLKGKEFRLPA